MTSLWRNSWFLGYITKKKNSEAKGNLTVKDCDPCGALLYRIYLYCLRLKKRNNLFPIFSRFFTLPYIHGFLIFIIYACTSLASHFVPLQASPAVLLGRFAPLGFMLAFSVASLPHALCFALAFSGALLLWALHLRSRPLCCFELPATRSNLACFAHELFW